MTATDHGPAPEKDVMDAAKHQKNTFDANVPATGLGFARALYDAHGEEVLGALPPAVAGLAAIGLVGEGSECFGLDDQFSHDHDWGPAFCLWLPDVDLRANVEAVEKALAVLPETFMGHPVRMTPERRMGRVGPLSIEGFYARFIRTPQAPRDWRECRMIPEHHFAVCTNGAVFMDALAQNGDERPLGGGSAVSMTTIRNGLLAYYPRDLWLKKIAARCALMAQAGQYNLPRSLRRRDPATASLCAARFAEEACTLVHHLARRFTPFYKWAKPSAAWASPLGREVARGLDDMFMALPAAMNGEAATMKRMEDVTEGICIKVIDELREQQLSDATDGWLLAHAESVQSKIETPELAGLHVMME